MHLEHYEPHASWKSSIWMFVAGTAIGAVAALIMAPASGRDSRDYLKKRGRKMADDLGVQADKLASAVKWGQEHASSAVRGTMDQAKAAFNAAKSYRSGETTQPSVGSHGQSASSSRPTPARTIPSPS
jgi:gas vesicle protein